MLQETTIYTAICDRCEKDLMDSDLIYSFVDEKELNDKLESERWHDTGQLHFCPDCYTIENDEIKLKPIEQPEPPTWEHRDAWSGGFADNY